jgi:xylulokinase
MYIRTHQWIDSLVEKCGGPDLKNKLRLQPVEAIPLAPVNPYYVKRYGFSSGTAIKKKKKMADWTLNQAGRGRFLTQ